VDPNPSAAKVVTRKISHDLRDLNSLRAGAMTGARRLQRQVIRAPEPAKISCVRVSNRFMVVFHSLLRISPWATNPRQSGHTAPAPAGAFVPAPCAKVTSYCIFHP